MVCRLVHKSVCCGTVGPGLASLDLPWTRETSKSLQGPRKGTTMLEIVALYVDIDSLQLAALQLVPPVRLLHICLLVHLFLHLLRLPVYLFQLYFPMNQLLLGLQFLLPLLVLQHLLLPVCCHCLRLKYRQAKRRHFHLPLRHDAIVKCDRQRRSGVNISWSISRMHDGGRSESGRSVLSSWKDMLIEHNMATYMHSARQWIEEPIFSVR
jgi:hypothetical protein